MLNRYLISILVFFISAMCNAENASVYFSEIKSIDKHNIFTVLKNGEERLVRLAYLRTPILGEFKHDITHSFLRKKLLNKWVRISELPGTGRAKVYRAIIRDNQQKIINVQMASRGLGIPVTIEQPPLAILKASKIAKEQNLGVWQNSEQFKKDRKNTEGENFLAYLESVKKTLASQKDKNNQIFIGNKKTKEFSPMKCVKNFNKAETVVFATKHVGLHRKYTFIPCPKENLPPK